MEGGVDGRDDARGQDEDLGRRPLLADGLQTRGEERQERLDGEDRLQEVRVEEVGEARGRNGGDGRRLVVQAGDEDDGLEREVVRPNLRAGYRRLLQVAREAFDGCSCSRRLLSMNARSAHGFADLSRSRKLVAPGPVSLPFCTESRHKGRLATLQKEKGGGGGGSNSRRWCRS